MIDIFQVVEHIFGNFYLLLSIMSISCILKWIIFSQIIKQRVRYNQAKISQIALLMLIAGSALTDFSWIPKLLDMLNIISIDYSIILFFIRIAWATSVLEYQGMSLFLESLSQKNYTLSKRQILFSSISIILAGSFLYFAFFDIQCSSPEQRSVLELKLRDNIIPLYTFFLPIFSLILLIIRIKTKIFPHILKKQLIIFMRVLSIPIIGDFLQVFPFVSHSLTWVANSYATVTISTITLTWAMYYYSYKISDLRFLNLDDNVAQRLTNPLLEDFRITLEHLGAVTNPQELKHITITFFKETFYIPITKTHFYIREITKQDEQKPELHSIQFLVETFISTHKKLFDTFIAHHRILLSQEIEFSNFYHETETSKEITHFLNTINADIFVPIYHNGHCLGYIVVEKNARTNKLYTRFEQDQIILYTTYLGNIIHLLQTKAGQQEATRSTNTVNKLFQQKCELSFYKESIKTFYGKNDIGIITYKNRSFVFNNKEASMLLTIDPNTEPGDPIAKALMDIVKNAKEFHATYVTQIYNKTGQLLQLSAIPNLDNKNITITISHPNIADIIKPQLNKIRNQTEWNYLLYLQTTEIGQLIQSFLPGNSPLALQFNIDLLKKAIHSHTFFIQAEQEDETHKITRFIHAIHKRKTIHSLHITHATDSNVIAIQLFGINPLFDTTSYQAPLMETLNKTGTLLISNVHLLSREVQNQLADYIEHHRYRPCKSEQTYESNVTIICTNTTPLVQLVDEGKLETRLYSQLRKNTICLPDPSLIAPQDLYELMDDIAAQIIGTNALSEVLQLTSKEKERLKKSLPRTISKLKKDIELIITKKIERTVHEEPETDNHPLIDKAAKLGKLALKDKVLMQELLSLVQNKKKVATILGVNRSSIYRHYKDL